MPLPSSGPLSIADIRNEGVAGGCYPAGDPYSLGLLATAFGIPTDPDSISEFYGRSCPATGNAFCVGYSAASDCCISITNYSFECDFCQLCTQ